MDGNAPRPHLQLPSVLDSRTLEELSVWACAHADALSGVVLSNPSQLMLDWPGRVTCDYAMNVTNALSARVLFERGAARVTLSPELRASDIRKVMAAGGDYETRVYGRLPLMTLAHCPINAARGGVHETCNACDERNAGNAHTPCDECNEAHVHTVCDECNAAHAHTAHDECNICADVYTDVCNACSTHAPHDVHNARGTYVPCAPQPGASLIDRMGERFQLVRYVTRRGCTLHLLSNLPLMLLRHGGRIPRTRAWQLYFTDEPQPLREALVGLYKALALGADIRSDARFAQVADMKSTTGHFFRDEPV